MRGRLRIPASTPEAVSRDWRLVEDALNTMSNGASDPAYSQAEDAKGALFRLCDRLLVQIASLEQAVMYVYETVDMPAATEGMILFALQGDRDEVSLEVQNYRDRIDAMLEKRG